MTQPAPAHIYAPAPAFFAAPESYYPSFSSFGSPATSVNSSTDSMETARINTKKRKEAPLRSSVELMLQESRKRRNVEQAGSEEMAVEDSSFTPEATTNMAAPLPAPMPVVPTQAGFPFAANVPEMLPYAPTSFPTSPSTYDVTSEDEELDYSEADGEWTPQIEGAVASLPGLTRLPNGKFQLEVEVVDLRDAKTGASEWTCPVCQRIFTDSSNFNKHTLRHTTEKPAVCNYEGCGKRFTHTSTLKDHIDAIHLQIRKYKCNWPGCNKAFSNQSNKSRHMRTHNGSKPYTCHLCSKAFSQSSNLKVHLKTHDKK